MRPSQTQPDERSVCYWPSLAWTSSRSISPIGILFAGFIMALTYVGGDIAESALQLPSATIQMLQGMLLFFLLALDVLTNFRIRFKQGATA